MDKYTVTYMGDSTSGVNTYYRVNYKVYNGDKINENFDLYPNAQQNAKMQQIIASPDTKHYLFHDIYTHVSSVPLKEDNHDHEGHSDDESYLPPVVHEVIVGDTVRFREGQIVVKSINRNATIKDIPLEKGDAAIGMNLEVLSANKKFESEPIFLIKGNTKVDFGKTVDEAGLKLRFTNVLPDKGKLELTVYEKPKSEKKDWIVLKAIEFPYINLFWGGTIMMVIGFLLSIFRRSKEAKTT